MPSFYEMPKRSNELYHYGRLGMKWGKHIFGKNRVSIKKGSADDANEIYKTLSKDDRAKLDSTYDGKQEKWFDGDDAYNYSSINSFVTKQGNTPISLFYIQRMNPKQTAVDIVTRSEDKYRGKGYASKTVKAGMKWLEKHPTITEVYWDVRKDNVASISLAKKNGFDYLGDSSSDWSTYVKRFNKKKR